MLGVRYPWCILLTSPFFHTVQRDKHFHHDFLKFTFLITRRTVTWFNGKLYKSYKWSKWFFRNYHTLKIKLTKHFRSRLVCTLPDDGASQEIVVSAHHMVHTLYALAGKSIHGTVNIFRGLLLIDLDRSRSLIRRSPNYLLLNR